MGVLSVQGPYAKKVVHLLNTKSDPPTSPFENFAATLVEAMSCAAPIITTNTTAMPEACGKAALYFSPDSAQELSACIMVFLNDEKTRLMYKEMALLKSTEYEVYSVVNKKTNQLLKKLF